MSTEITLNLWYVIDDLGFIYSLRARAYIGQGSDEEKLEQLQSLASTDYLIARIFPIPKKYHIHGQPFFHKSGLDLMETIDLFQEAIEALQSDLPSQTPLDIPDKPLVCITPLFGNDDGDIRPFISD
jgi:hypothetical protein